LKLEFERDGFAKDVAIVTDIQLRRLSFAVENRTGDAHTAGLRLSLPVNATYELRQDGRPLRLVKTGNWDYPWRGEVVVSGATTTLELVRTDRQ